MKIHAVEQGSVEWLIARAGVVTASEADNIVTPLFKTREGLGLETYLFRKLAEKLMGQPIITGASFAMEQGSILESEAVPWLEFTQDVSVKRVGFITSDDGRIGCSPDGLIGDDGGVEIKCPQPDTALKYLLNGVVPKDYLAQVHFSMHVTGRPWWKFVSYSRQFPPMVLHVKRDERIQDAISTALEDFFALFDAKMAVVNAMKAAEAKP